MKWVQSIKHLGNTIACDLNEEPEIGRKLGDFTYRVNALKANFRDVTSTVILKLFNSFCTSFYGSQAWDLVKRQLEVYRLNGTES